MPSPTSPFGIGVRTALPTVLDIRVILAVTATKYSVPHVVCDDCFLRSDLDDENLIVRVTTGIATGYIFGHVIPRKGLAPCHGADVMVEDIARLGYHKLVLLKGDK